MESKLNGLAISKGVSTDEVVRTIQALISAGYKGDELLEKIDEIYGVGARNNLLKVIEHTLPVSRETINVEYPIISPSEKTKIGDCLLGSNGYVGQITDIMFDSESVVSSVTVLGLGFSIVKDSSLPTPTTEDVGKVVMVGQNSGYSLERIPSQLPQINGSSDYGKALVAQNGQWVKDYVHHIGGDGLWIEDVDTYNHEGTGRSIYMEGVFVPYSASDTTIALRFSDDNDRLVRLIGVADPTTSWGVANKNYVDNHAPLFLVFSGTTEAGNASCDTDWATISSAINSGRPIHARYLEKSYDGSNIYYDLSLKYSNAGLSGNYLFIEDLSDPASTYDKIDIRIDNNLLYIHFISV